MCAKSGAARASKRGRNGPTIARVTNGARILDTPRRKTFDAICAGEPLWRTVKPSRGGAPVASARLLAVTRMLAQTGARVGLATALADDRAARASVADVAALGVDVGAVTFGASAASLVVVDASGGQSPLLEDERRETDLEIPASWSAQVLFLSGLSAVTSQLAALCKAARRARRNGTVVVLDVVGSLRHWAGRDARVISMVLHEADVVCCSVMDLAVIGTDSAAVRRAMRPSATLVVSDAEGATAIGAFGELTSKAPRESLADEAFADAIPAAICAEYARPRAVAESTSARWHRILGTSRVLHSVL
jgi:sugar/nucleoside kinase (ribokinase family)